MGQPSHPKRTDYETLNGDFQISIASKFEILLRCEKEKTPDELWKAGKEIIINNAKEQICKKKKKTTNWISDEIRNEAKLGENLNPEDLITWILK